MVEEVDTSKILDEMSRNNAAPARKTTARSGRSFFGRLLILLFLLVPLLAIAALLGYQQWTLYLRLNTLATENNQLRELIQSDRERLAELEAGLGQAAGSSGGIGTGSGIGSDSGSSGAATGGAGQAMMEELRDEIDARLQQIERLVAQLRTGPSSSLSINEGTLMIAEAEQLLRIANRQLPLTADITTAINLLETADQLLTESGDNRVAQARQAIAGDLSRLRAVEEPDLDQLSARLMALGGSIAGLNVTASPGQAYQQRLQQAQQQAADENTADAEENLLDSGIDFLNSVFVWREWEEDPEIVQPAAALNSGIQVAGLLLDQAQLALLTRRQNDYRQSLQRLRDLVSGSSSQPDPSVSRVVQELDSLMAINLTPQLPDLSQSLNQVRQLVSGAAAAQSFLQ